MPLPHCNADSHVRS